MYTEGISVYHSGVTESTTWLVILKLEADYWYMEHLHFFYLSSAW